MVEVCSIALLVGISILASVIHAQIEMKRMSEQAEADEAPAIAPSHEAQ